MVNFCCAQSLKLSAYGNHEQKKEILSVLRRLEPTILHKRVFILASVAKSVRTNSKSE